LGLIKKRKGTFMKYAIFGASGAVGKELAKELYRRNQSFRVVGRREAVLRNEFSKYEPLVEYCEADLSDPKSALRAAQGIHTLFYLVGVPYPSFKLHPHLTQITMDAAIQAGVQRLIHVSTVYPYGKPQSPSVSESHPREPHTFKGQMRKQQEDIVTSSHGKSGLKCLIVCPPDYYGGDSELSLVYRLFKAALDGGPAQLVGPIDVPHEFIYVPDLAEVIAKISDQESAYGQKWNVGGPGVITIRKFAEEVYRQVGRKPRLQVAGKTLLRIFGLFNPIMKELVELNYLMTTPVILDDQKLRNLFPQLKKTSYEEGIRLTLESMKKSKT
jgi:nucleoside-diphosphate-sugar epimerase